MEDGKYGTCQICSVYTLLSIKYIFNKETSEFIAIKHCVNCIPK